MNDIQEIIARLRESGWTISAISDALDVPRPTVERWRTGVRYPANAGFVRRGLEDLLAKRQIPKRRRVRESSD